MDILVTVGGILLLIALTALMIHLLNVHHEQSMVTHHYDSFHPGDPPDSGRGGTEPGGSAQRTDADSPPDDQRDDR